MKVTLYKVLAIKKAIKTFDMLSIPDIDETDYDSIASVFIVGLSEDPSAFNELISTLADEGKDWSENLREAVDILKDFFIESPNVIKILIHQLKIVNETLKDAVLQMMQQGMEDQEQIAEVQEKEQMKI